MSSFIYPVPLKLMERTLTEFVTSDRWKLTAFQKEEMRHRVEALQEDENGTSLKYEHQIISYTLPRPSISYNTWIALFLDLDSIPFPVPWDKHWHKHVAQSDAPYIRVILNRIESIRRKEEVFVLGGVLPILCRCIGRDEGGIVCQYLKRNWKPSKEFKKMWLKKRLTTYGDKKDKKKI